MRISLTIPMENTVTTHGYGVAAQAMVGALQSLGHTVPFKDPDAPVEIAFCQPYLWEWSNPDAYHIGYVPWESTRLPANWLEPMKQADEIWTTSEWCKAVYEKNGFENVRVYQHGVDVGPLGWTRKRRRPNNRPIKFLHIGEPAPRKGGQLTFDTFRDLFPSADQASLTIKSHGYNTVRGENGLRPDRAAPNVKVITDELETWEMIDLVKRHDVLVYPSWGEGFGLIPLQAMATGMPVICTWPWAPYAHLLDGPLAIGAHMKPSPWPDIHPGMMYEPVEAELRAAMQLLADPADYANYSARAYARSFDVEREYNWVTLTESAFAHIVEKFSE